MVDSDLTSDLGSYIARSSVGLHFHICDQSMSIHFTVACFEGTFFHEFA